MPAEDFDPIKLEASIMEGKEGNDDMFSTYDNMLFSGSHYTGDKLLSKEKDILDKYKNEFESHAHTNQCHHDEEEDEDIDV